MMERHTVTTAEIATMAGCSRAHATDRLTKEPDCPRPVINRTQKLREWDRDAIAKFLSRRRRAA